MLVDAGAGFGGPAIGGQRLCLAKAGLGG